MSHPLALPKFSQPAAPPLTGACLLGCDPLPPLSNLGTYMELGYGRTVWDLVGDRICSATRDAARLFLILLSFAVHGHHGNGPCPCIGTTAGMASYQSHHGKHRARGLVRERAAGELADTRELLSTLVSYSLDDYNETQANEYRRQRRRLNYNKRRTQSEYWPYRYPESSDA